MKIQYKNYTLQPGLYAKDRFDILKTITVTVKTDTLIGKQRTDGRKIGDTYEKEEELAYDMLLENAIPKIILYLLAEKEDTTDLKGFLGAYKKHRDAIEKLLKP